MPIIQFDFNLCCICYSQDNCLTLWRTPEPDHWREKHAKAASRSICTRVGPLLLMASWGGHSVDHPKRPGPSHRNTAADGPPLNTLTFAPPLSAGQTASWFVSQNMFFVSPAFFLTAYMTSNLWSGEGSWPFPFRQPSHQQLSWWRSSSLQGCVIILHWTVGSPFTFDHFFSNRFLIVCSSMTRAGRVVLELPIFRKVFELSTGMLRTVIWKDNIRNATHWFSATVTLLAVSLNVAISEK